MAQGAVTKLFVVLVTPEAEKLSNVFAFLISLSSRPATAMLLHSRQLTTASSLGTAWLLKQRAAIPFEDYWLYRVLRPGTGSVADSSPSP
jgi:hypothetical protein